MLASAFANGLTSTKTGHGVGVWLHVSTIGVATVLIWVMISSFYPH